MKILLYFFMGSISTPLMAKNYALFFSGVDSQKENKNIFLNEYKKQHDTFVKGAWETKILYGDEKESEYLVKSSPKLAGKVKPATKQNIFDYLDNLIKNAGPGDQVLLSLNGHGGPDGSFGIINEKLKYSDPKLLERFKKINEKGIKLAVTMDTCFGGSAIPHFSPYACVVSSQTNNSVSYGGPVQTTYKKMLEQTLPKNMNDYYLQMLAEATTVDRMIPMTTASFDSDSLAQITTGLYRKDGANATVPVAICIGPEAMDHFAEGFTPITKMVNAEAKYKKVCKVFGVQNCVRQAALADSLQKMNIKNIDAQTDQLEGLSDELLLSKSICTAEDITFNQQEFKLEVDFKNIILNPNETKPLERITNKNDDVTPGVTFSRPEKVGLKRTYTIKGGMCEIAELTGPESIARMAKAYAKSMYIGPQNLLKANTLAELGTKIKTSLTLAFSKMLTPEQKEKLELNKDVIKEYTVASQNYRNANIKHKADLRALKLAKINQALAYKFLDEGDHVSEKDKVGRQKCEDFKLR